MKRSSWGASVLALGIGTTPALALATEPESGKRLVQLQVDRGTCEGVSLGDVATILRVELLNRVVEGPLRGDAYRTAIDCSGPLVAISVGAPGGAARSVQTNLGGVPANVHARIVALAIAELVRDLDGQPRPVLVEHPRPPPPPPVETRERDGALPLAVAPSPVRRGADLEAFAQTSSFQLNGAWLTGGGLRFDYAYGRLSFGFDAAFLGTTERFELGTARVLIGYGGSAVAWQETWGRAQTRLGAGYAFGAATVNGHATDVRAFGATTTGPWSAPYGFAALAVAIAGSVSVEARGQVGWVTSPVTGEVSGGPQVALEGVWATVQMGLALAL